MPDYRYHPTPHFTGRLRKIKNSDPPGHRRIMQVIDRLLETPSDADGRMHGTHHGKFKKYVGRGEYRLLYYYCELCRKANRRLEEACSECDRISDQSVVFFDVYHKNEKIPNG